MGDIDDRDPLAAQLPHELEQVRALHIGQGGGRLIQDQDLDILAGKRLQDGHHLALDRRHPRHPLVEIEGNGKARHEPGGPLRERGPIDPPQQAARAMLPAQKNIIQPGHIRRQFGMLLHGRDPGRDGVNGGAKIDPVAVDPQHAAILLNQPGQDFDKGRFAGPIDTEQRMNFTPLDPKIDLLQGDNRAIALADIRRFEDWRGHRRGCFGLAGRRGPR